MNDSNSLAHIEAQLILRRFLMPNENVVAALTASLGLSRARKSMVKEFLHGDPPFLSKIIF